MATWTWLRFASRDSALLGVTGVFVILLNIWLVPRRKGFQQRYAQRGIFVGVGLVVAAAVMAVGWLGCQASEQRFRDERGGCRH